MLYHVIADNIMSDYTILYRIIIYYTTSYYIIILMEGMKLLALSALALRSSGLLAAKAGLRFGD